MKYKVLIVDDDINIIEIINRRLMFEDNLETIGETNPIKALEIVKQKKIDIVLLDISMPEMDGITTLRNIKNIDGMTQVIIMTGFSSADKAIECMILGANDYLIKPFDDMDEVVKIINISIEKIKRWKRIIIKSSKNIKI